MDFVLIRARDARSKISSTAFVSPVRTKVASAQWEDPWAIRVRVPAALSVAMLQPGILNGMPASSQKRRKFYTRPVPRSPSHANAGCEQIPQCRMQVFRSRRVAARTGAVTCVQKFPTLAKGRTCTASGDANVLGIDGAVCVRRMVGADRGSVAVGPRRAGTSRTIPETAACSRTSEA